MVKIRRDVSLSDTVVDVMIEWNKMVTTEDLPGSWSKVNAVNLYRTKPKEDVTFKS